MQRTEPRQPTRGRVRSWLWYPLVAALAYAISIALYHVAVHAPSAAELASREGTLRDLERRVQETQAGAKQLDELRSAMEELELDDRKLDRFLPGELPNVDDLAWLDSLVESAGAELIDVEVGEVRHRDFYYEQSIYVRTAVADLDRLRAVVQAIDRVDTVVDQLPAGLLVPVRELVAAIDRGSSVYRVTKVELDNLGDAGIGARLAITAYADSSPAAAEDRTP